MVPNLMVTFNGDEDERRRSESIVTGSNNNRVYRPGQTIPGTLMLEVTKKTCKLQEIYVQFLGKAKCRLGSGKSSHYGAQVFFNHQFELLNPSGNGVAVSFCVGQHFFNMTCNLPLDLPGSIIGEKGAIYYKIKVTILPESVLEFRKVYDYPFTILDHRLIAWELKEPLGLYDSYKIWIPTLANCGFRRVAIIDWNIHIPRSEYLVGEYVQFSIDIDNRSQKVLNKIVVRIVQEVEYIANKDCFSDHTFKDWKEVAKLEINQDVKGPQTSSYKDQIQLPDYLASTSFGTCYIISIRYFVQFKIRVGVYKLHQIVPIIIGNVRSESS